MSNQWTVVRRGAGGYRVIDDAGRVAGEYASAEIAAIHHAIAIRRNREMLAALHRCDMLLQEIQSSVSVGRQQALQATWECVKQIVFPEMREVKVERDTE